MSADGSRRWDRPGWSADATTWILATLAERGITPLGDPERVRSRFWSVHLRVDTDAGPFWFKENCPRQSFEASLVDALQPVAAELIVPITATDPAQGWLLSPDQGPTARDAGLGADVRTYEQLVIRWARVQRAVLSAGLDLRTCGVDTLDPARSVPYLLDGVERLSRLPVDDPGRMDEVTAGRLRALAPSVQGWVEQVEATGLPIALDHSDLHLGNAFDDGGSLRIFDFSDAVLGFPLCTLLVPLRMMASGDAGPVADEREQARGSDAYLEVFSDLAPARELRSALPAALELAKLNRHESWLRALDGADAASHAELGGAPAAWLGLLGADD